MNTENIAEAADRFGAVAQQFCSVVDSAANIDRTDLLVQIYRILPRLVGEAITLPYVKLGDDDDLLQEQGQLESPVNVRLSDEQCRHLYNLLKERLGDWDSYMQVFDPTADNEAIFGSLADDIADIYRDLKEGLVLKEKHLARQEDVIWTWRLLYYSHWGKHAIDALRTIHFRLEDANS